MRRLRRWNLLRYPLTRALEEITLKRISDMWSLNPRQSCLTGHNQLILINPKV
jgi:hypothetical protein